MSQAFDHRTMVLRHQPLTDACPFKLWPREVWQIDSARSPRLLRGPKRGDPSGPHAIARCPECGRRLRLAARYNSGSGEEFSHWEIPDHRPRAARAKAPKRQSRVSGRGK